MSRVGNSPISLSQDVNVDIDGNSIKATGPKGSLDFVFHKNIIVENKDNIIHVNRKSDSKQDRSCLNMIRYAKELAVEYTLIR